MRVKRRFRHLLCAGWLIASSLSAWSQSSLYFDRGSFVGAAQSIPGNFQTISYFPDVNGPELTISDVTFQGRYLLGFPNGILWNFDGGDTPLSIHFANGALAFGANSASFTNFTATLSLDNGEVFTFPATADPSSTFFGFISPTPIRDLTFSDGGTYPSPGGMHEEVIGNVVLVTIPEVATLALLGLGGLFLAAHAAHRRFRRDD